MAGTQWIGGVYWAASIATLALGVWFAYRILAALELFDDEGRPPAVTVVLWLGLALVLAQPWRDLVGKVLSLAYMRTGAGENWAPFGTAWGNVPIWFYALLNLGMLLVALLVILKVGWNRVDALLLGGAGARTPDGEDMEGAEPMSSPGLAPVDRAMLLMGVGYLVYLLWDQLTTAVLNVPFVKRGVVSMEMDYARFLAGWGLGLLIFLALVFFMYRDASAE